MANKHYVYLYVDPSRNEPIYVGMGQGAETRKGLQSHLKDRPQEQISCPHYGKCGGKSVMKRWHFDECGAV